MEVEDVLESKEFKQFKKHAGEDQAREFLRKTNEELKELITVNSIHEREVKHKMLDNKAYIEAKAVKKDFDDAVKDKLAPTKAASALAVAILHGRK